ncbi:hypothetical protein ABL78_0586 [Leptomonas seymouri]|uniref:Uncharacterized protein n=1 Tax=Leptomonas seymouri TaxID=5684 RepID=A0A0N0P8U9_LEPSE|nr:hypothetical protein ABL78_0586 [Leptomonas seymouri]|eukprot:KPI90359.1 hypothetical protein ABL78_0586 [Leptomonas seymouri]
MARVQKDQTWMKNHPLEGDDVVSGLYNILAKRNPKTMKACHGIRIPDTVVFEHNFPRGWYTTDMKANEVVRKQGKELDSNTIEQGFTQDLNDSCPIAATYLCTTEMDPDKEDSGVNTLVEVFNKDTLGAFLARKTKLDGILQKFVFPKGYQNSVIKAVWSPRVCMVQRRTNKYRIFDRKRAECDPFSTTVTYDGPTFLSEEGGVSGNVAVEVKALCGNIVQHFYYTEHKCITRMVLYFKSDKRDRLWLLWCGSLRVSERDTPSEMPVNLITNFAEPNGDSAFDEDKLLRRADEAYLRLTSDEMFYETYVKPKERADTARAEASAATSARATDDAGSRESGQLSGGPLEQTFDWTGVPTIVLEARDHLCREEESMCSLFEDLFYHARSHLLTHANEAYDMVIPQRAVNTLTENGVVDLMRTLRIPTKNQPANASGSLRYVINSAARQPLTQLSDRAQQWIKNFFNARLLRLQQAVTEFTGDVDMLSSKVQEI